MKNLRGRKALITGAASGIGRGIAMAFAAEGVDLCLWDVNQQGLESTADEIRRLNVHVDTQCVDLSQPDRISNAIQICMARFGPIDLLVNNAGIAFYGPTHSMSASQWNRLMGINLLAPIQITRELLPMLLERPEAHILNICSISGLVAGGRFSAYHTSKFGLIGFTESLRAEYGRRGLGVTALCPGPVLTNLYRDCAVGQEGKIAPQPPRWLCSTVETVSRRAVRAVRRNQRMPIIGPLAHLLVNLKWLAPGLIDFLNHFKRRKRKPQSIETRPENSTKQDRRSA